MQFGLGLFSTSANRKVCTEGAINFQGPSIGFSIHVTSRNSSVLFSFFFSPLTIDIYILLGL